MLRHTSSARPSSTIDHGYAWVVLASCFLLRMLVDSFWSSLGILFLKWQAHFDVRASSTAWIGSIFMLILLSAAPVSSALAHRFTYRVVVICAGIVTFACVCAISVTTQFWQLYMFMPVLSIALGVACQAGSSFFVVFFDKRLALANGLNSAGSAVGVLTLPPLMEILISYYGWRGALQITAAIMANTCVCGALLPPPPRKVKRLQTNMRNVTGSHDKPIPLDNDTMEESHSGFFKEVAKSFDLSLFRNIRFIFQGVGNGLLYGGNNTAIIYLIPYAVSVGIPNLKSSYLMVAFGISGLITRLCPVGWIVDKKIISASTLGGIAFLTCGLNIVIASFTRAFTTLMILSVVFGVSAGIAAPLRMVVVTYAVGNKHKAPGAIAWMLLHEGVGSLLCILLMGYLYDISGNYRSALIVSGACLMCLGINMLTDPCVIKCQNRFNKKRKEHTSSTHAYVTLSKTHNEQVVQV